MAKQARGSKEEQSERARETDRHRERERWIDECQPLREQKTCRVVLRQVGSSLFASTASVCIENDLTDSLYLQNERQILRFLLAIIRHAIFIADDETIKELV
jgi:hypothetical protein